MSARCANAIGRGATWSVISLICAVMHIGAGTAVGMPTYQRSVELQAATSDIVVVGSVRAVDQADLPGLRTGAWRRVTVDVRRVLRGPPTTQASFYIPAADPWSGGRSAWVKRRDEAVFFLVSGARVASWGPEYQFLPFILQPTDWREAEPVFLEGAGALPVLSAEMRELTSPDEILAAVGSRCASSAVRWGEGLAVPASRPSDWPALLYVPVDSPMQTTALRWARSPDLTRRWNAVRVLRHGSPMAGADAVRSIAGSPVGSYEGEVVHETAVDTLRTWGAQRLAVGSPAPATPGSSVLLIVSLLAVVASPWVARAGWRRAARATGVDAPSPRLGTLAVIAFVLVLWGRSYFERDALTGRSWDLGCWDGRACVIYRSRNDVTFARPWQWCRADEVWTLKRRYEQVWGYSEGTLGRWHFVAGQWKAGEEVFPMWTVLVGFDVPFWSIASVVMAPSGLWGARAIVKQWPGRRAVGFPVVVPEGEER